MIRVIRGRGFIRSSGRDFASCSFCGKWITINPWENRPEQYPLVNPVAARVEHKCAECRREEMQREGNKSWYNLPV